MTLSKFLEKYLFLLKKDFIDNPKKEFLLFVSHFEKINFEKLLYCDYEIKNSQKIIRALKKRNRGESFASIVGEKEFYNCKFLVNNKVLIPRPETEFLIEEALTIIKNRKLKKIIDLCSGPGTIGLTLKKNIPEIDLTMVDISNEAYKLAKKNIVYNSINQENITILKENILSKRFDKITNSLFKEKFDLVVSNPPYIESKQVKALIKEKVISDPKITLDGGDNGLDFYYKISQFCHNKLKNGGYIILEIGFDQQEKVRKIFTDFNFIKCIKDFSGNDRVLVFSNSF